MTLICRTVISRKACRMPDVRHAGLCSGLRGGLLCLIVFMCGTVAAQTPDQTPEKQESTTRTDLSERVPQLLDELGSGTLAARVRAERELVSLGPSVLDLLPPLDLLPNISVQQAVGRIRVRLEQLAARDSLRASRITLKGRLPLRQVVAEIRRQTGNSISLQPLRADQNDQNQSEAIVECDWSDVRFWDAIGELEKLSLEARFDEQTGELRLHAVDAARVAERAGRAIRISEVFRIDAGPVSALDLGDGQLLLKCEPRIVCEPRVRPLFLRFATNDLALIADDGRRFRSFNPDAKVEVPLGQAGREARLQLAFVGTGERPKSLSLEGAVSLLTAAREQPIEFRDLANARGVARRVGGVTVTLTSVLLDRIERVADRPSAHIRIRVAYDTASKAFESHQLWLLHNRVFIESPDADARPPNGGIDTLFQGDGLVDLEYRFVRLPQTPSDWKFVYMAPTLLVEEPLDLELRRIPVAD